MPLGLPRLPDLPAYPTLLTAGLAFALYIQFYDRSSAEIRPAVSRLFACDATAEKIGQIEDVRKAEDGVLRVEEDATSAVERPVSGAVQSLPLTPQPSIGPNTPPASPPPSLRPDAPVFRPRSSTRTVATPNVWANNIPQAARDFRAKAEKEYAEGCECKKRAEEANAKASKLIYEGMKATKPSDDRWG